MKSRKGKPVFPEVADQIRTAILEGGLVPGSKIVQDQLATSLGVSRLPIREALLVLHREGLVLLDHRHGAIVAPLDVKFISDVFDCRAIIEGYVAAELASRVDIDISELRQIVRDGLDAAQRRLDRHDLVIRFHVALYEAVGNQVLVRITEPLLDHVQRALKFVQARRGPEHPNRRSENWRAVGPNLETWNEHAEIVDAIARRDIDQARMLAQVHVERVKQATIAFLVSSVPDRHRETRSRNRRRRVPQIWLAPN